MNDDIDQFEEELTSLFNPRRIKRRTAKSEKAERVGRDELTARMRKHASLRRPRTKKKKVTVAERA